GETAAADGAAWEVPRLRSGCDHSSVPPMFLKASSPVLAVYCKIADTHRIEVVLIPGGAYMLRGSLAFGVVLLIWSLALAQQPAPRAGGVWQAEGKQGAVAAGGQEAVDAGIALMKQGGNAIDGAVATILALSVTDSRSFCFGGEVPIMVY